MSEGSEQLTDILVHGIVSIEHYDLLIAPTIL